MRLSIVKKSHQQLLLEIASRLRSSDPKDGLEHVLNCYLSPCTAPTTAPETPAATDDLSALASWE